MKKELLGICLLLLTHCMVQAQKGRFALSAVAELTAPGVHNNPGLGFSIKGAMGISPAGQITLSTGIWLAGSKDLPASESTRLVPVLLGYQHSFKSFFIEPSIGIGELGGRASLGGDWAHVSVAATFAALQLGYRFQRWSAGMKFLAAKGIEGSDAGLWHDRGVQYAGVFASFDIFPRKRK